MPAVRGRQPATAAAQLLVGMIIGSADCWQAALHRAHCLARGRAAGVRAWRECMGFRWEWPLRYRSARAACGRLSCGRRSWQEVLC